MSAYGALSASYDALTRDIDYEAWADYLERQFQRRKGGVKTVLDLACGAGTLSWILAQRGYEVIGTDSSPDMLAQAASKGGGQRFPARRRSFSASP